MLNRFVFVCPMYNCTSTVSQTIMSVFVQSYTKWRLLLIDDMSNDDTIEQCASLRAALMQIDPIKASQIEIISNDSGSKRWEVENVLRGVAMCDDEDIVCRIDGDDWLTEIDALHIINYIYNETRCDVLWTKHRWGFTDFNVSKSMSDGFDPYKHEWVSSHLKTFKKRLINGIPDENFRNSNREYVRRAGDQAIYLPVLKNSVKRIFVPMCMYHYTIDMKSETFQSDDAKFQKCEGEFLRQRGYIASGCPWEKKLLIGA